MNSEEKLKSILEYFSENGIDIPTEVKNSIEDLLSENKETGEVSIYNTSDLEELKNDLSTKIRVHLSADPELNIAEYKRVYPYYGSVDVNVDIDAGIYSKDDNGNIINDDIILAIPDWNEEDSGVSINNPEDWLVLLVEKMEFKNGKINEVIETLIYCPNSED